MAPTSATHNPTPFIDAILYLGSVLELLDSEHKIEDIPRQKSLETLYSAIDKACQRNPWFTAKNCRSALAWWGKCLTAENLTDWLSPYVLPHPHSARIALILAGNVPVVGLHDLLAVLVTGHTAVIKLSSKDDVLLPALVNIMAENEATLLSKIEWAEGMLAEYDGVIATGSGNTSRYFEYYFGKNPHIIRKNRNAVAVLKGDESDEELTRLADDIFLYFGLGCRNVSKLFLPEGFRLDRIIQAAASYEHLMDHHKYANNYNYHKTIYLMGEQAFTDGEYCLFLESQNFASPIGTIYYETYHSLDDLAHQLAASAQHIQAIVSHCGLDDEIAFGHAQKPDLTQYADGVDTVEFLLKTSFK